NRRDLSPNRIEYRSGRIGDFVDRLYRLAMAIVSVTDRSECVFNRVRILKSGSRSEVTVLRVASRIDDTAETTRGVGELRPPGSAGVATVKHALGPVVNHRVDV